MNCIICLIRFECVYIINLPTKDLILGEELLTPTKIYASAVMKAVKSGKVKAFAHITGGGLTENIPRVLPDTLAVDLDATTWGIPPVFSWLATAGGINEQEMLR